MRGLTERISVRVVSATAWVYVAIASALAREPLPEERNACALWEEALPGLGLPEDAGTRNALLEAAEFETPRRHLQNQDCARTGQRLVRLQPVATE